MRIHRYVRVVSLAVGGVAAIAVAGCGGTGACDPNAPGTICTIAGSGATLQGGYGGDNGPATDALLYSPTDVDIGPNGEVWISDYNNYRIRAIDRDGIIRTVVGTGVLGDDPPPGVPPTPALETSFNHVSDMTFTPDRRYLYIAAWHNSRIKRLDLATMTVENIAGTGKRGLYTGDGGRAIDADLDLPCGVAIDPQGNVAFVDQANQVIRSVDPAGTIHTVAGQCVVDLSACKSGQKPVRCPDVCPNEPVTGTYGPTDPNPADLPCQGETPSGKFTCGDPSTCDQICAPAFAGDGGAATEMHMNEPFDQQAYPAGRIAYDTRGDLFFADTGNNRIREIDTAGIVHTVAGNGTAGYSGDGGPATDAELNRPVALSITADGSIYFTDTFNNCIRKVDPEGVITTVAGRCTPNVTPDDQPDNLSFHFAGDGGDPTRARLNWPFGLDVVGHKLYIADTYNNRIRVVNL